MHALRAEQLIGRVEQESVRSTEAAGTLHTPTAMSSGVGQKPLPSFTGVVPSRIAPFVPLPTEPSRQMTPRLKIHSTYGHPTAPTIGHRSRTDETVIVNAKCGPGSTLLLDEVLPRYDVAVTHAAIFRAPPHVCYRTLRQLDLFRHPVVQALFAARAVPERVADRLTGHRRDTSHEAGRTFSIDDLARPPFNWLLLAENSDIELVLGEVARPWKPAAASAAPTVTSATFTSFNEPGFAKIVFGLRVDPRGATSSVLTAESRVELTDVESRRRFRRYWRFVGPFSELIRRVALRMLEAELRQPTAPQSAPQPRS